MNDPNSPVFQSPYISRFGETPLTRFLPLDQYVHAEIASIHIPDHLQEFVTACHRSCFNKEENRWDQKEVLKYIGEGKTLWQCGEIIRFGVRCNPVSRVFTHQLVRARIGVSYSQQCTGDVDCRHLDYILPNCYLKPEKWEIKEDFIKACLAAKQVYADSVDYQDMSIQEARYILPGALTSWIFMDIALGSLAELFNKRCCTMTQTWEMVIWAQRLLQQIQNKAPWALPLFRGCDLGCWFTRTIKTPFANTHLWMPDEKHEDFCGPWNNQSFVHKGQTHLEVSSGPSGIIEFYSGKLESDISEYMIDAKEYGLG